MAPLILKTRPCYLDIFCRLANETISRFPSCCICQEECVECSCQGRNLPSELECFDMCGSNGQPSGSSGVRKFVMNTAGPFSTLRCTSSHLPSLVLFSSAQIIQMQCCWYVKYESQWRCHQCWSVQCQAGRRETRGLIPEQSKQRTHAKPWTMI